MSDNQEAEMYSRALEKLQSKYDELLKSSVELAEYYGDTSKQVHISKIVENEDEEVGSFVHDDFDWPKLKPEVYGWFQGKRARDFLKKVRGE